MKLAVITYSSFLDIKQRLNIQALHTSIQQDWPSRRYAEEILCLDDIFRHTQNTQYITEDCLKYYLKITGLIKENK